MSDEGGRARWRARSIERERATCVHFTGIQNKCCAASVNYMSVRDTSGPGMAKFPCLTRESVGEATTTCEKRELQTLEQATAKIDELIQASDAALERMRLGICECGVEATDWKQVGPCVYAEPCGHRVGQGDAKKVKAGVLAERKAVSR